MTTRNIWDTVYDNRDFIKWHNDTPYKWFIVAKHNDWVHYIVEYEDLKDEVFKEDLSQEWFSKEHYDEYSWIDNSFEDADAYNYKEVTKELMQEVKKHLISNMPK